MITAKQQLGRFFTKRAQHVVGTLSDVLPQNSVVIDPFAGECDLLYFLRKQRPDLFLKGYDLVPTDNEFGVEQRDTLLDPPNYSRMWVVTNPPYLARNKSTDKAIFDKYRSNDLYKAAVQSIIGCEGGILILPLNFFCDEHEEDVRMRFLSQYKIQDINIFEEQVFEDTDYVVASFSFIREDNTHQTLHPAFLPGYHEYRPSFEVKHSERYRIGFAFYQELYNNQSSISVSRLVKNEHPDGYISRLYLHAVDSGTLRGRIRLTLRDEPYWGKESDRAFATIVLGTSLTSEQEQIVVDAFSDILERFRWQYRSLFLTNFRNASKSYSRKRISFKLAFALISYILRTRLKLGILKKKVEYD